MNVKVNVYGSAIKLSWDAPESPKPEVTGYEITYYKNGDKTNPTTINCGADCTESFLKDNLDPFAYYTGMFWSNIICDSAMPFSICVIFSLVKWDYQGTEKNMNT